MGFYKKRKSIRTKMLMVFLPILLVATSAIAVISVGDAKKALESQIEERVGKELAEINESIEHEFTAHEKVAESVASVYRAKENSLLKTDYRLFLEELVKMNDSTLGTGLWLEPGTFSPEDKYFGPYVYRDGASILYTEDYETTEYDYPTQDWYLAGKALTEGSAWSSPYYDETTGITMITTSIPVKTAGGFQGVVTADYDLSTIQERISAVKLEKTGYAFLLDQNGLFIAHEDAEKVMNLTISEDQELKDLAAELEKNPEGKVHLNVQGKDFEAYYLTLESTGWKLVVMAPLDELYGSVDAMVLKGSVMTLGILVVAALLISLYSISLTKASRASPTTWATWQKGTSQSPLQ